ncbi:MAG: hypothetical protein GC161_07535 [Planctomycetaceae bacterium]|nr:hypothetical protein [Planctomycetaceae bacterium]
MPTPQTQLEPAGAGAKVRTRLGLLALFLVALGLRLWPIDHGDGANYLADTHVVRSALGMAKDKDLVPKVGTYSTYPNLLPYALLPIYAGQYAIGRATGAWSGAGEYGNTLLERPALAHVPARVLVALLGALTALVAWKLAREAGFTAGAWFAGAFVALGLLHVHFSVQERPWAPLALFLLWSALHAGRAARTGSGRELVLSGAVAGLAFATHQGGLLALALPGIAWLVAPWRGAKLARRVRSGFSAVLAFALLGVAVGHPYLVAHGPTATEQVAAGEALAEMDGTSISVGGQAMRFAFSTDTLERLSGALFGYDPALVLLGLGGIALAARRRNLWPALLFAGGWGGFFLLHYNDHVRYLLPLAVFLALPAGAAAEWLWTKKPLRAVVVLALLFGLVQSLRLGHLLRQSDTRTLALAALAEDPPAVGLAVDVFGPEVPLDGPSLERLSQWRDLYAREWHRAAYYDAGVEPPSGAGFAAMPVDALLEFEIRRRSSWPAARHAGALLSLGPGPNEWFAALGLDEVLLVDRSPGDDLPPPLLDPGDPTSNLPKLPPLRVQPEPVWVIDPSRGATADEARLPTELNFALTDLWQVTRPGPRLERRRLAP